MSFFDNPVHALFLSVSYEKQYGSYDHVLKEASIYITLINDIKILDSGSKSFTENNTNTKKINELNLELERVITKNEKFNIKFVYVYGDNKIFHRLSTLRLPKLRVINVKTFHDLNLSQTYDVSVARSISQQKPKEYPNNRYSMQSLINLCGLIAQNYVIRYSHQDKKLYPTQRVNDHRSICVEYNLTNIFRVILYNYATTLLEKKYSIEFIEPLYQQILLNMFYPNYFNCSLCPSIYLDEEKIDDAHEGILILQDDISQNLADICINHNPQGLLELDQLAGQFTKFL